MKKIELKDLTVYMGNKTEIEETAKELGIELGKSLNVLEYDTNQNLTMLLLENDKEQVKTTLRGILFSHALMNVANEEITEDECIKIGFDLVNQINEVEHGLEL